MAFILFWSRNEVLAELLNFPVSWSILRKYANEEMNKMTGGEV